MMYMARTLAVDRGVHHLDHGQPRRVGQVVDAPGLRHRRALASSVDALVAGQDVGQAADVAGALDVGLAAQRVDAGGGPADLAGDHRQVGERLDELGAVAALGDAHRVEDGGVAADWGSRSSGRRHGSAVVCVSLPGAQAYRRPPVRLLGRDAGAQRGELGRVSGRLSAMASKPSVRAAMKSASAQPSRHDHVDHRQEDVESVPGAAAGRAWRGRPAAMRRGSITISEAPRLTARTIS